jgi:hypothetical protein
MQDAHATEYLAQRLQSTLRQPDEPGPSLAAMNTTTPGTTRFSLIGISMVAGLGLALTACSASTTTPPTPTASAGNNGSTGTATSGSGGGQTANLTFQVNFTGDDTVMGSFTSNEWQIYTCSDFAKSAFAWNLGTGPQEGVPTTVGGKLVNFLLSVPTSMFHGPGTYSDVMPAGVTTEGDDFSGSGSTMTINSDGSGNASFTSLPGSGTVSGQTESGTVTWTCG